MTGTFAALSQSESVARRGPPKVMLMKWRYQEFNTMPRNAAHFWLTRMFGRCEIYPRRKQAAKTGNSVCETTNFRTEAHRPWCHMALRDHWDCSKIIIDFVWRGRDARILHKWVSTGDSSNLVGHGYSSPSPGRRLDEWLRALLIAIAHRGNGNEPQHERGHI